MHYVKLTLQMGEFYYLLKDNLYEFKCDGHLRKKREHSCPEGLEKFHESDTTNCSLIDGITLADLKDIQFQAEEGFSLGSSQHLK